MEVQIYSKSLFLFILELYVGIVYVKIFEVVFTLKNMKRLGPEAVKLKKKKKDYLKTKNHGFTKRQTEANTGRFTRTTVGDNILLRVFQFNLDGRLPNKSNFQ